MSCCFRADGTVTRAWPPVIVGAPTAACPPFSDDVVGLMSVVLVHGDGNCAVITSAEGAGVRVVGEGEAGSSHLVDQIRSLSGDRDLHRSGGFRGVVVGEEYGQGREMRQDLVLADVGVLGSAGVRADGAGVAVAAPVGGACRWTMLIPAAARTGLRPAARPAGTAAQRGLPVRAARWRPGRR